MDNKDIKLLWQGPGKDGSGYSSVMRTYVYWFNKFGYNINVNNISYNSDKYNFIEQEEEELLTKLQVENLKTFKLADHIFINHATPDILFRLPQAKKAISYSVWETSNITKEAGNRCNEMDYIITASEFSKAAFLFGGVKVPIHVVPHIVTKKNLDDDKYFDDKLNRLHNKLTFLSIFEWHLGKGYDVLIKGFIEAFKDNPDVQLILKVNSFINQKYLKNEVINYIKSIKGDLKYPTIIPICNPVKTNLIYALYRYCDIYVTCTRREAFGLTIADAIVHELPVIVPNKGGHRAYCNYIESVIPFKVDWKEITEKDVEKQRRNYVGQSWMEPDLDHFIKVLRVVGESWKDIDKEDRKVLREGSIKLRKMLHPTTIMKQFNNIFKESL